MKLGKWTMDHTKGALLGVITPLLFVPVVLLIVTWTQGYYFDQIWKKFAHNNPYQIKMLTLSIISNLGWFYFFLNKERYNIARGIIIGSLLFAPYVIYIKFF